MLTPEVDWARLKADCTFIDSDSLAVIRTAANAISWLPVVIQESTGQCFVSLDGRWVRAESASGFERFQRLGKKTYFNTATLQTEE